MKNLKYTCRYCTYSSNWKGTTYPHSMTVRWNKACLCLFSYPFHFPSLPPSPFVLFSTHSSLPLYRSPSFSPFASLCQLVSMWPCELLCQANKGTLWGSNGAKRERKDLKVTQISLYLPLASQSVGEAVVKLWIQTNDSIYLILNLQYF